MNDIHISEVATLREIMEKYTILRTAWIKENGGDEGFDQWFTNKLIHNN